LVLKSRMVDGKKAWISPQVRIGNVMADCDVSPLVRQRGFTLVELIVTLILVGILSAVAIPRFMGRGSFDTRGFHDQVITAIQFARQQAVAQRRQVCVTVTAAGLTITRALAPPPGVCGVTPLLNPTTGAGYALVAPAGVVLGGTGGTLLPLVLTFDPLGQVNVAAGLSVTGDGVRNVTIEAGTGYVHQ